ncbi:MAG: hypothetical protein EOP23_09825 [Hyphomicrobiales bacterium]|nr:MAG: hypothetical protein EOP23_09825 [Hyphomicrobiales bacterium]
MTVRPMTASQSQKSRGGLLEFVIMKGTPELPPGSAFHAMNVASAAFREDFSLFERHPWLKPAELFARPRLAGEPNRA